MNQLLSFILRHSRGTSPLLVIILSLAFSLTAFPQEKTAIQGIIFESESEMPLSGAHIVINGSSYGTITGPDGSFRLLVSEFPTVLRVSHIGFEERLFTVTEDLREEKLMMGLKFSPEMLEGVTISDEKVEIIFKSASYSVLDFEFHENGLMLLIYRNTLKRSELILLSNMNDTLSSLKALPGRSKSLHRDCKNNIHYVAFDSAYQIHFTGERIKLIHPVDIMTFLPVAKAFAAYNNDNYYYGITRVQKQIIQYMRFDSISQEYFPFCMVADKKTLEILKDNPNHGTLLNSLIKERFDKDLRLFEMEMMLSAESTREALHQIRSTNVEAHYLRECVYYPVYAPLFSSGSEMILFNHPESSIDFLTPEGAPIRSIPIKYHDLINWGELILKDDISGKYFTVYIKSNRIKLNEIDIHSGMTGKENIMYYPFVKKILVRNGYAYFTYRQPGSDDRTMLFRQKLLLDEEGFARTVSN